MTVKTIFKVLLTTIVGMVLSMLILELFNVSIASYQLRQIGRMSARQACILFTSETYKGSNDVGGSVKVQDVKTNDGTTYVSGDFYHVGLSPNSEDFKEAVWKKIYGPGSNFSEFCNQAVSTDLNKYYTLGILKMAADGSYDPVPTVDWSSSDLEIEEAVRKSTAQMYRNNYYTTANIGIPYMDKDIVNQMYQWNLAQLLSNCNPDSIQKDDNGNWCVNFRGFKIYADQCQIKNYDYRVYDVSPSPMNHNRAATQKKLWDDLNIDTTENAQYIGAGRVTDDAKGMLGFTTQVVGKGSDGAGNVYDNWYVTSVGIEYNLVANYEGITPLRKLIAYVFQAQVAGHQDVAPPNYSGMAGTQLASGNSSDTLSLGGYTGSKQTSGTSDGVVTTGKLVYVLDR